MDEVQAGPEPAVPSPVPQPGMGSGRSLGMTAGETGSGELCCAPWLISSWGSEVLFKSREDLASPCLILSPVFLPSGGLLLPGSCQTLGAPQRHPVSIPGSAWLHFAKACVSEELASCLLSPSVWQVASLSLTMPFMGLSSSSSRAPLGGSGAILTVYSLLEVSVVRPQLLSTACLPSVAPPPPRAASCSGLT